MIILEDLSPEERKEYFEKRRILYEKQQVQNQKYTNIPKLGFRCEQYNITKTEGTPTFTAQTKSQFELQMAGLRGKLQQTDFFCEFSMKALNDMSEILRELEFIRNGINFELSDKNGKIQKILNKKEMRSAWINYRDNELRDTPFIKRINKTNDNVLDEIIKNGNMQFSDKYPLIEEYDKSLFHHILFNKYLVYDIDILKDDILYTPSQLFRDIILKIDITYKILKKDAESTSIQKIGTLDKRVLDMVGIKERYDINYKPLINYSFTDFDYEYNMVFIIDNNTKQIKGANASMYETVKNNCENVTSFKLKQIEL